MCSIRIYESATNVQNDTRAATAMQNILNSERYMLCQSQKIGGGQSLVHSRNQDKSKLILDIGKRHVAGRWVKVLAVQFSLQNELWFTSKPRTEYNDKL